MRFLWEQSWKVLDGTVELAEMYSKAISWLPTQECEPPMWEALLLVGAMSLHKPMTALCAAPKKREASSSQSETATGLAQREAKQPGAENLVPAAGHRICLDALPCLSCYLNNHTVYKDFLPGTLPGFLPRLLPAGAE